MNKLLTLLAISLFGFGSITSQGFYDINTINTLEITFEANNWDYLLDQLVFAGNEERLVGSVSINGQVFDSVGVRYKGNSSYNPNQVKNPLNIKLDYIFNDQEIEGYGTLKLANVYKDPSFVRETLSYEIARNYFPASQANYANVYINGTHLGLYTSVQDVDKFFMRNHFNNDEKTRVKGELNINGNPGQMGGVWEYWGNDSTDYFEKYTLESATGWNELVAFLDTLNNHTSYVEEVLNIDRHLWFLAFSNLLVNLDGPINNPQNYYIFKDCENRFNPIPWDLNESFGVFTMLENGGPQGTYQLQHLDPFLNDDSNEYPIISAIIPNDTYRKMYVAHMKTIIEEHFTNEAYLMRGLELQAIIDEEVQADPNKFFTYSDFVTNLYGQVGGGPQSIIGIEQLMDTRTDYLLSLSSFQYESPEILNISSSPEVIFQGIEVWLNAVVNNAEDVYLAFRDNPYHPFGKISMFDDGNHEDGLANDGVYGVSLIAGLSDIQFYIYAENEDACSFLPVRAEYEFFTLNVTGNLVINEFMADNENTVVDQDGEYDDWIELYNNGNETIFLDGYFLSDDASEPDQWIFPDTLIEAGQYLIIWADEDEDQEGLHANFKLSASGETILLSNDVLALMDEITFIQQFADTTTGRYPNGSGDFVLMPPSFASENQMGYTWIQEENIFDVSALNAYPNPFSEKLTLEFYLEKNVEIQIQFCNVYGQCLSRIPPSTFSAGKHQMEVDTEQLNSGIWICYMIADGRPYRLQLMKI